MKLSDLKIGDQVHTDDGFTCMKEACHIVHGDERGLFLKCDEGKHYLDGQEDDETGELVGIATEAFA
jgi:hypothetical protein